MRPPPLQREHFAQDGQDCSGGPVADFPQVADQARFVKRANLVQDDLTAFSLKADGNVGGIGATFGCQRGDNDTAQRLFERLLVLSHDPSGQNTGEVTRAVSSARQRRSQYRPTWPKDACRGIQIYP